jgi:hypothetical protein
VHCVIIGFGLREPARRLLFDYPNIRGEPQQIEARNINPYLVDAGDVLLPSRTRTPPGLPRILQGSKPVDGGHLIFSEEEKADFIAREPEAAPWMRRYLGGEELINGRGRWCLWLNDISPAALKQLPLVRERLSGVQTARLASPTDEFRRFADYPTLFVQDRQPTERYLGIVEVSSENRKFVPMQFLDSDVIASNKLLVIVGATNFHFAILNSTMHMAWMRVVAGRLKSDYSYAPAVYNNFPWPTPTEVQRAAVECSAQGILDARAAHPDASLADLYDPLTMPPNLVAAHAANDRAVDAAYGQPRGFPTEAARLAFLFDLYQSLVAPLDATPTRRRPRARRGQG